MTVLDIPALNKLEIINTAFKATTVEEIFIFIKHVLHRNPTQNYIFLEKTPEMKTLRKKLEDKFGFDFSYDDTDNILLRFRGYSRWVYYSNNKPVYFTSSCVGNLSVPPHETKGYKSEFTKLNVKRPRIFKLKWKT